MNRTASPLPLLFAGAALVLALWGIWPRLFPAPLHRDATVRAITPRGELAEFEAVTIAISEENAPSVVSVTSPGLLLENRFGQVVAQVPEGTGTGFVWSEDGYIVTNAHVVEGRKRVQVRTIDLVGYDADVVGVDPSTDVAVLRVRGAPPLRPIPVGSSGDLRVGQAVFAIGNPFGFSHSLTTGVVSALQRALTNDRGDTLDGLIQVDAAINPGNSGGPLLDSAGRLIGVNTAIYSPTQSNVGIGFAIPVDTVNQVVPQLIRGETPTAGLADTIDPDHPTLGVYLRDVTIGGRGALQIREVVPASGAASAGLRPLDLILAVDDEQTPTTDALRAVLSRKAPGDRVEVEVLRGYERVRATVVLSGRRG
jgi:S1-C subfamily serine protease